MKLSVIIPVYNTEAYLSACLDSVLTQSMSDLEVFCIDDASTDRSAEIIRDYCRRDPRVHLLQNETNRFAGACRNRGIEASQGEFLHFLDSDDLVMPGLYEKVLALAEAYDVDVIKGRGLGFVTDPSGSVTDVSAGPLLDLSEVSEQDFLRPFSISDNPELLSLVSVVPWNGIYRRSLIEQHQIRYNSLVCVNDRSFFNEVTLTARRILLTRDYFVHYRVNQSASLMGRRAKNFSCELQSYQIVKEQLERYPEIATPAVTATVLDRELADVFLWYRRYRTLPEGVGESIISQTKAFAEALDLSIFHGTERSARWYPAYLQVTGQEPWKTKFKRAVKAMLHRS